MIEEDIQKLEPGTIVALYELDLSGISNEVFRWATQINNLGKPIKWRGEEWIPWPLKIEGLDRSGAGTLPRPVLTLGNVNGFISAVTILNQDIVGAKFTRYRTLSKYLDKENFEGEVNPTADPNAIFPTEIWYIDRKAREDNTSVEFELASPFDVEGVFLPKRQIVQNYCPFIYKNAESGCSYVPGKMFDANDNEVFDPAKDVCGHRLSSCQIRHPDKSKGLPFGGFPGAGISG